MREATKMSEWMSSFTPYPKRRSDKSEMNERTNAGGTKWRQLGEVSEANAPKEKVEKKG